MTRHPSALAAIGALLGALFAAAPAWAQKHGGVLKLYTLDSPASMSILEETTADDGGLQQPGHVRSAREAEQSLVDRARLGHH